AVLDVVYAPWPTRLAQAAAKAGAIVVSGFDLLLHQAARQVELMTGHEPAARHERAGHRLDLRSGARRRRPLGTRALLGRAAWRHTGGVVPGMGHARTAAERSAALLPGDGHAAGPGHGPSPLRHRGRGPGVRPRPGDRGRRHAGRRARLTPAGPRRRAGTLEGLPRPGRSSLLPGHSLATPVRWIHAVSADSFTRNLIFR